MKARKYIHQIKNVSTDKITFIILCAKKSNRRGFDNIPLTPISIKECLIDRQIETIKSGYKNSEIIIMSGFEYDRVVNHIHKKKYDNVRIVENSNYKMSNTIDGWRNAINVSLEQDTYIIHGDRVFSQSCIINNDINNSHVIVHNTNKHNYNLGISSDGNRLINMSYGLPKVWSEILFISKKDFSIARDILNEYKQKKIYTVEGFINYLSNQVSVLVLNKKQKDIQELKEI